MCGSYQKRICDGLAPGDVLLFDQLKKPRNGEDLCNERRLVGARGVEDLAVSLYPLEQVFCRCLRLQFASRFAHRNYSTVFDQLVELIPERRKAIREEVSDMDEGTSVEDINHAARRPL